MSGRIVSPEQNRLIRADQGIAVGPLGDYPCISLDVETNPNVTLLGFLDLTTAEVWHFSNMPGVGAELAAFREWWPTVELERLFLSFNGAGFDNHIIRAVLGGTNDPEQLWALGQRVLAANQGPFLRSACYRIRDEATVDLMAICRKQGKANGEDGGGLGSLKEIAVKINYPVLRTMPFAVGAQLSPADAEINRRYNVHDCNITGLAGKLLEGAILSRLAIYTSMHVDVLNDSDAKLAERIMSSQLFGSNRPTFSSQTDWLLAGRPLVEGFSYQHPELIALAERISDWLLRFKLVSTPAPDGDGWVKEIVAARYDEEVKVGDVTYRLGYGGLHSADAPLFCEPHPDFEYWDADVTSYYPSLISNHKLAPPHLNERQFLTLFNAQRQRRNDAKARYQDSHDPIDKAISDGLKISTNSLFGKTGSAYSFLLDPTALVRCTLLGQLTLLLFVDLAHTLDVEVISANTDGITLKIPRARVSAVRQAFDAVATTQRLSLEWVRYHLIARRAINDYFAVLA